MANEKKSASKKSVATSKSANEEPQDPREKGPEKLDLNQVDLDDAEEDWESTTQKNDSEKNRGIRVKDIIEPSGEYSYASFGRPDPFMQPESLFKPMVLAKIPLQGPLNDGKDGQTSLLQTYMIGDLKVKGIWQQASKQMRAIIVTPKNQSVVVKEGDPIATGKIYSIARNELKVRLYKLRSDGIREFDEYTMMMNGGPEPVRASSSVKALEQLPGSPAASEVSEVGSNLPSGLEPNSSAVNPEMMQDGTPAGLPVADPEPAMNAAKAGDVPTPVTAIDKTIDR
jgi:Tfp pilus assembly protein PilP